LKKKNIILANTHSILCLSTTFKKIDQYFTRKIDYLYNSGISNFIGIFLGTFGTHQKSSRLWVP